MYTHYTHEYNEQKESWSVCKIFIDKSVVNENEKSKLRSK
jgi:hypothetical protein